MIKNIKSFYITITLLKSILIIKLRTILDIPSFHFFFHIQYFTSNFRMISGNFLSTFNFIFCWPRKNLRIFSIKPSTCLILFIKLDKLNFRLQNLINWLFGSPNNFIICYFFLHVNHARRLFLNFLSFVAFAILKIKLKELLALHTCRFQWWNLLFLLLYGSH